MYCNYKTRCQTCPNTVTETMEFYKEVGILGPTFFLLYINDITKMKIHVGNLFAHKYDI